MTVSNQPRVLVIGASRGIGLELARQYLAADWEVHATTRVPDQPGRLGELPGVTVTGSVPEVQPFVHKAALSVAPLGIARGTQNKILESLAMGVPCICSELAAGGVDAVPGEHLLTASTPQEYARAILRLVSDPDERRKFAEAGRSRVVSNHSWSSSMKKLDSIIDRCLARACERI